MAGCQWMKFKGAQNSKAVLRHNDKQERKKNNHSNEEIDTSKTDLNVDYLGWDYEFKCKAYDYKIKQLEANAIRLRADRVTMFGIEIPIPNEIPDADVKRFVERSISAVADTVGVENIIAVDEHSDEQHTYIDAKTKQERLSMRHIHVSCVPGVDGRLNGKQFCTRSRMVKLNNEMQEICETEFGCKFMTGEKTKSKDNVENLKLKSKRAELDSREEELHRISDALDQKAEELHTNEELEQALQNAWREFKDARVFIDKNKAKIERNNPEVIKSMDETQKALNEAEKLNDKLKEQAERSRSFGI